MKLIYILLLFMAASCGVDEKTHNTLDPLPQYEANDAPLRFNDPNGVPAPTGNRRESHWGDNFDADAYEDIAHDARMVSNMEYTGTSDIDDLTGTTVLKTEPFGDGMIRQSTVIVNDDGSIKFANNIYKVDGATPEWMATATYSLDLNGRKAKIGYIDVAPELKGGMASNLLYDPLFQDRAHFDTVQTCYGMENRRTERCTLLTLDEIVHSEFPHGHTVAAMTLEERANVAAGNTAGGRQLRDRGFVPKGRSGNLISYAPGDLPSETAALQDYLRQHAPRGELLPSGMLPTKMNQSLVETLAGGHTGHLTPDDFQVGPVREACTGFRPKSCAPFVGDVMGEALMRAFPEQMKAAGETVVQHTPQSVIDTFQKAGEWEERHNGGWRDTYGMDAPWRIINGYLEWVGSRASDILDGGWGTAGGPI